MERTTPSRSTIGCFMLGLYILNNRNIEAVNILNELAAFAVFNGQLVVERVWN